MKKSIEAVARLNWLNSKLADIFIQADDLGAEQAITFMQQIQENSDSIRAALDEILTEIKEG